MYAGGRVLRGERRSAAPVGAIQLQQPHAVNDFGKAAHRFQRPIDRPVVRSVELGCGQRRNSERRQ